MSKIIILLVILFSICSASFLKKSKGKADTKYTWTNYLIQNAAFPTQYLWYGQVVGSNPFGWVGNQVLIFFDLSL